MIKLGPEICQDLEASAAREWLETNGIGGYASSTIAGTATRRYHGLLIAATRPPLGRTLLLSKFEETVIIDGQRFELSCNQYPGTVFPVGYKYLVDFRLDPFPVWTYKLDDIEITRKIFMVHGENSTVVSWSVINRKKSDRRMVTLKARPLIAFRGHHQLRHEDINFDGGFITGENTISIAPVAGMPALHLANNAQTVEPGGDWYHNFEYAIEQERGFDFREDLSQPCVFEFDLSEPANVIASTEPYHKIADVRSLEKAEMKRRAQLVARAATDDDVCRQLVLAADQFIVSRDNGKTVIAGYPWFSDWGRDTMIALNGLTLVTNRPEIAKSILMEFGRFLSEGMLPNRFPEESATPEYNTVDATLWFFEAIRAYTEHTGDYATIREVFYPKLVEVIDWHVRGTRYGIHLDTDGLLYAGEPDVQLTWMDAKIGDWVVTPRTGKAVEIQALWFNALTIMAGFADGFGDDVGRTLYAGMADIARETFNSLFWNEDKQCLYDVIDGEQKDATVRPNQIFAVSLAHPILEMTRARKVVDKVEAELLTPYGLRTLSPSDPNYKPVYIGSPLERDAAYHQGTVWAWLMGPFIDAYKKVHAGGAETDAHVEAMLSPLRSHMTDAMVGQVSEIFDADAPNTARGCPAQAWSVAELLRVLHNTTL